jgi:hypothetical protein
LIEWIANAFDCPHGLLCLSGWFKICEACKCA